MAELAELIAPLADEVAELAFAIALWLREAGHSVQLNALKEFLKTMENEQDSVDTTELKINKQVLLEAIQ
ncbi:MAG TPA: hypothetical protein DEG17_09615 [Cyanobacteria bacterium UBA11149]|nr:hypothetical protein [Cyanobacteria bacterium UBA11367]HBE57124.1 hypothetical protein [Cyanobacteria bacterium UBA11366]HBK64412.1 hypothetical protein [Cyanobacteria bacterium UBA11166]HBR75771.1 hypothetical protein [Cyanobacteria bacterium UBA11159]HBS69811.1 hypothetical protein [Cyanobacteria bacterium UBA11153]HBW89105.1 hypothetical protein [Cyanobacteria bacterium UBA11149]HCA96975.1 hypothetical protein [Cyanobacteria bacterium UBA9226]